MAEMQEKIVEVDKSYLYDFKVGDHVNLIMERKMGKRAVFLAYLLPFLIVMVALIVFTSVLENEGLAGLLSLAVLVPYYIIIYYKRDKLRKVFHFRLE
jgi:sigma-E factor negative regulatory protein RseC